MEDSPSTYYQRALESLELIDVICQPEEIAKTYLEAAEQLEAAGDYQDAPELAKTCRIRAEEIRKKGREDLYDRALVRMQAVHDTAQLSLARDMFLRAKDCRDAKEQVKKCEKLIRREERRCRIRRTIVILALLLAAGEALAYVVWEGRQNVAEQAALEESSEAEEITQ